MIEIGYVCPYCGKPTKWQGEIESEITCELCGEPNGRVTEGQIEWREPTAFRYGEFTYRSSLNIKTEVVE